MGLRPLGREIPTDFSHVDKYPLRAAALPVPFVVNRALTLPYWHWSHDQGSEGSCVGHAAVMERTITNLAQNRAAGILPMTRRYNPLDVWREAKRIDGDPNTDPANDDDGTYVSVAYDVLRDLGPWRVRSMRLDPNWDPYPVGAAPARDPAEGVTANRWAHSVDEMRAALAAGIPVVVGTNWYTGMDEPEVVGAEYWIGRDLTKMGTVRGGHAYCIYGASDRRQAFRFHNSWGTSYPLTWVSYALMERLLGEYGEAVVAVDR